MANNEQSQLCDVKHKEPWYSRFIPFTAIYLWEKFKTRNDIPYTVIHAQTELKHMLESKDEMDQLMAEQVLELIDLFSSHEHSGFSAQYAISLFSKLARHEPIGPLTGDDNEWSCITYGNTANDYDTYQNIRASHVFKHVFHDKSKADYAYDINGKVFREPSGATYTSHDSKVQITFPYTPVTEYIDVTDTE